VRATGASASTSCDRLQIVELRLFRKVEIFALASPSHEIEIEIKGETKGETPFVVVEPCWI
jgi:hypothetical protein